MRKALAWAAAGTTIAAGLLSMAATANAAVVPHAMTPTKLLVHAAAPVVKPHGKDAIVGNLWAGHKPLAGRVVWLEVVDGRKVIPVGAEKTNKAGAVAFAVSPKVTTSYELAFKGTNALAASHSGTVTIKVIK